MATRKRNYHHGDLRAALLEAARALLTEGGIEALSLRAVARRAGVSAAAPYHHFKDKAELVSALERVVTARLAGVKRTALEGLSDPEDRLRALGVHFVCYSIAHPAEFRLLCRPEMRLPFDADGGEEDPSFQILLEIIDEMIAQGRWRVDRKVAAVTAWSLVHGLASLLVDGPLRGLAQNPEQVRALAESVTGSLRLAHEPRPERSVSS